jgi:hypothetical protein
MENSLDQLRKALQHLITGALNYLGNFDLPVRQVMFPEFPAGGGLAGGSTRLALDARWATMGLLRNWESWPQFVEVLAVVRANHDLGELMLTDAGANRVAEASEAWALSAVMAQFLHDYIEAVGSQRVTWNEDVFSSLYNVFAESIQRGGYVLTLWTPLYNCDASSVQEPIELAPGISIVEPDEKTRLKLLPTWLLDSPPHNPAKYYVRAEERVPFHRFPSETRQMASGRVVTGVRLAVGGNAYIRDTRAVPQLGSCRVMGVFGGYSVGLPPPPWPFNLDKPSVVHPEDIEAIKSLTGHVPKLNEEFPIAVTRFTSTTERSNPSDRLIDANIGLENMLLQGIRDELAFRLALRGAWLLADTPSSRLTEYKQLQRIYRARSVVVHGSPKSASPEPEIVDAAIDSLRRVLRKAATLQATASDWKVMLDSVVFGLENETHPATE